MTYGFLVLCSPSENKIFARKATNKYPRPIRLVLLINYLAAECGRYEIIFSEAVNRF